MFVNGCPLNRQVYADHFDYLDDHPSVRYDYIEAIFYSYTELLL
jgi:hypothetical protein